MSKNAKNDAVIFADLIKDRVCDWIIMHGQRPAKPENVHITNMTFEPGWEMQAMAEYTVDPWKRHNFYTHYSFTREQYLTTVMDPYGVLTKGWNGISYLEFDDEGRSYEVTGEEARIIDNYKRLASPRSDDVFYKCKKCGTKFAANSLDIWLDDGLYCPVCKAGTKNIKLIGKATENG